MKRLRDRKLLTILVLLLLVAVAIWRWSGNQNLMQPGDASLDPNSPDAFVVNGRYHIFREDGQLSSLLRTERAVHFPQDNTGHMENPQVEVYPREGKPWHIESREGLLEMASDTVILRNNVVVESQDQNGQPVVMNTEELSLNNRTRFITTDLAVKITSQQSRTTAIGMDAHVDAKQMLLKSHVRGTYVPAKP